MKKYFLSANTSAGYVSFYDETVKKLSCIYTVTEETPQKESEEIFALAEKYGADEMILNPMNTRLAMGCVISRQNAGVFGASLKNPIALNENHRGLYKAYGEAKQIHDEWEKIYIDNMDTEKLNKYCDEIIYEHLNDRYGSGSGINFNRFFGSSTPETPVNFIDELTEDLETRCFIKGRPGTGKSTFLKKFRDDALSRGFDTETYYCSFDPNSLDMVVIRELSLCIFDSTAPHEKFPADSRDSILDFYEGAGLGGVDEKYAEELKRISDAYNEKMQEGNKVLKKLCEETENK